MAKKYRSFSREFKLEAVSVVLEGGRSVAQTARDLGIHKSALWRWKKQYEDNPDSAFPGKGKLKPEDEEVHRLRRELASVREERGILKKAVGIFSRMPK